MKYIVKLEKENGEDCGEWVINTEFDFDVSDIGASQPCDDYFVKEEIDRLGAENIGKSMGKELVMQIAYEEHWEVDL